MGEFSRGSMWSAGAAAVALTLVAHPAYAQRTEENVNTQSSDAFGRSVGSERSGLYSQDDVRGFNPVDAGNVRLEGLYFDLIDRLSNRLFEGNAIRVGLAAQRYPFPAPTGLVDFRLNIPGKETAVSLSLDNGNAGGFNGPGGSVELSLPVDGERLGFGLGFGSRFLTRTEGGHSLFLNSSLLASMKNSSGARLILFTSAIQQRSDEAHATYFPAGTSLPPQIPRGEFLGLEWTKRNADSFNHGAIANVPLGKGWQLDAGLFLSSRTSPTIYSDLLQGVTPDGHTSNRLVIADGNVLDRSLSGEMRVTHHWSTAAFAHTLTASLRGRVKDRRFGGSKALSLGPGSILATTGWAQPAFVLGDKNQDHVQQLTGGLAYNLLWNKRLSLDLSIAKSTYRKAVDFADPLVADTVTRDRPLLWNVAGSYALTPRLFVYAGYTRGLEEALISPEIATNRSEAPPAIRTSQSEAGLRYGLTPHLSLVAGVFSITKPYYNLDPANRYRQLGTLTNRGVEISLTGQLAPGLNIVGGTLFLDPRISGEAVDSGLIGLRPVGQIRRRSVANLDWRLDQGKSRLSLDVSAESLSARNANTTGTLAAPARTVFGLGARYRFAAGNTKFLVRPAISNLFNIYGWQVSSSGGFTYIAPRSFTLSIVADL